MPTYHARGITVRMGSMPLTETTTSDIVLRKGEVAKRQSKTAEKKLLRSLLLDEERILFPGDPDGYELNWLGNAPFMQVQAHSGFINTMLPQTSSLHGSPQRLRTSEVNRPQALALHVKLSEKAFISGLTGKTHLKIDVLFNGQLSACSLVHTNDIRSGAKSYHQVFAGYRVDFLAERPWVILPSYTTADGGTRRFQKTVAPSERWEQISTALLKEVEERGTNKDGESPPSAKFLFALARMQMPDSVKDMQKCGGRKFGVVDVVITAGVGSKLTNGTNYLRSPQRLRDSNYTVRTETRSRTEFATSRLDQTQGASDKISGIKISDLAGAYADADEDSNTQHERPRKRRALLPVQMLSQPALGNPDFKNLFLGTQIPYLPPPKRSMIQNDLSPIAGRVNSRCPLPGHRSDGHKEPLPPNDGNHNYEATQGMPKARDWSSDTSHILQDYHSPPPNSQSSVSHTLPMHSSPMKPPFSEPMSGHEVFGGPPFVTSVPVSSPLTQNLGSSGAPVSQPMLPGGIDTPASVTTPSSSTSYDWRGPPTTMSIPYYPPLHMSQQTQMGLYSPGLLPYIPPNGLPSLLPQRPHLFGHTGTARYTKSVTQLPAVFPSSGPLPPTAMFTVTSKPRRYAISTKDTVLNDPDAPRSSVLVSRLVITGLNGRSIIDHRWKVTQCIGANIDRSEDVVIKSRERTPISGYDTPIARSHTRQQNTSRNNTSRVRSRETSPNKRLQSDTVEQSIHGQRRDSIQNGQENQAIFVSLPYLKRHQGPTGEDMPINPKIDVPDKIAAFVSAPKLTPTSVHVLTSPSPSESTVPQRRNIPRNGLPVIQRPKAATVVIDDPEEVLREAARMRRSRSHTKPATTLFVPPITPPAQIDSTTDQIGPKDSSPLSSVPCSPVSEEASEAVTVAATTLDQILQLDGSPEHAIPTTSPRRLRNLQTLSSTKSFSPTPHFRRPDPSTPQSSASPGSKKRKASHRALTKPPRSLNRLKVVDNPSLNNDCIIAFAESEDNDGTKGVLRQVKGERQGVFKEEYVVLAVRFFIAGD